MNPAFRQALLVACLLPAAALAQPRGEHGLPTNVVTADIAAGIERHIREQAEAGGGYLRVMHRGQELQLKLVRVHLEYLSSLGPDRHFACVDLVGADGPVYDVDFFLRGSRSDMVVTDTSVHKVNGQPIYTWEQRPDGTWRKVPVRRASKKLLGVVQGKDAFDFFYRARLPQMAGPARVWVPLARSDAFQDVQVTRVLAPAEWRELDDSAHGNRVLFLSLTPAHSGKMIEVHYRVVRREKTAYSAQASEPGAHLRPERLVPIDDTMRTLASEITRGRTTDLMKARALYDHVIEQVRYARYGSGWGRGDAVYACDARSGNCTDFHALFIALARAAGIPARFAIGASIPSERNEGGIDGYHCWAEFLADGKWFPVDVSEADKHAALATYYFGHHPANRIELSAGRDLRLDPGPASGPINFLAYPVIEVDGQPLKAEIDFRFRRTPVKSRT
jgi:hypothetical protein